jgi:hypothetical protein
MAHCSHPAHRSSNALDATPRIARIKAGRGDHGAFSLSSDSERDSAIPQRIVGFHQDEERHWVADLECGHSQHVRHDPPMQTRLWVTTGAGRASFIGHTLGCVECVREAKL